MSILVFVGMYVVSDPVAVLAGEEFTEEDREVLAKELGVDKPLPVQYISFLSNMLQGDFGTSFVYNQPVLPLILERLPATLEVAFLAIGIGLCVGVPLGIYSGLNRKKNRTKTISFFTTIGYSIPNFWQALILIMIFAVWLKLLPASGRGDTTPIVTITGLELGGLIAFSTVTETVFSWPGIGKLLLDSIHNADRPVVVAYLILIVLMFVVINFLVDVLYALLDPRIRYT